ncbi:MAG: HAMP domain-containing histidine kinase, partial [Bacilli bacterium]|nr:HAMP domain-containing histidine kinase [Bacilli bacterium]
SVASNIIKNNRVGLHIGNLYYNKYSYNYIENDIIVINTEKINNRLILELIKSIIIFLLVEILIYIVSKILTDNITKPAEESFEKQKDFIADASHELKTPLAVIMASADELKTDKKNKKYIDNIKYETERMNTLIKSLLDLSKLEKGINIENYKDENISKIIERICLTFEAIAFENNVSINTNIEENINFKCSKEEIEKLISIIIDNAIKHSYKDSSIKVLVNSDKLGINIEVTNNGDPIKSGDEEKIFERFYRADKSRKRESNRYGLGLAIAKNIVLNHNGTIKAYSKDNFTTFKVNLKK